VLIALFVLILTLGSLVAAGMTLLNAFIGVALGLLGLTALSGVVDLNSTAPILALMLGLAVGIDYALFITARRCSSPPAIEPCAPRAWSLTKLLVALSPRPDPPSSSPA